MFRQDIRRYTGTLLEFVEKRRKSISDILLLEPRHLIQPVPAARWPLWSTRHRAGAPMATSTPEDIPSTPPPAPPAAPPAAPPKGRAKKTGAKVLEAQQSLRTRTAGLRSALNKPGTAASQLEPNEPALTARVSTPSEHGDGSAKLGDVAELIASLKETIAQQNRIITSQNDIIGSVRADVAAIKTEQQHLKNQNAELQETINSLRAQIDTLSATPPS